MENTNPELEKDAITNGTDSQTTPDVAANEVPKEPVSTHDAVAAAFKQVKAKHEAAEGKAPAEKAEADKPATEEKPKGTFDSVNNRTVEPMRPPASWTPVMREKYWNGLHPEVQKFITDRDTNITQTLSSTAEDRKFAKEIRDSIAPFQSMFEGSGTTPIDEIKGLMNISYTMQTGSQDQRAQIIHNMILQFLDPNGINHLTALSKSGHIPQAPAPKPINVEQEVQKRLEAKTQQEQDQVLATEIDKFRNDPANEFFPDVAEMMGRIIESGLVSGNTHQELFKAAYDLACSQHPEVKQVLDGRNAAQAQAPVQTPVQKAAPVRSVKPSLSSGKQAAEPKRHKTTEDAVRAALAAAKSKYGDF